MQLASVSHSYFVKTILYLYNYIGDSLENQLHHVGQPNQIVNLAERDHSMMV